MDSPVAERAARPASEVCLNRPVAPCATPLACRGFPPRQSNCVRNLRRFPELIPDTCDIHMKFSKHMIPALIALPILPANAQEIATGALDTLVITGKCESLIRAEADTASQGQANNEELLERPYLRRGELLEVIPGVIITQHSGDGKRTSISSAATTWTTARTSHSSPTASLSTS